MQVIGSLRPAGSMWGAAQESVLLSADSLIYLVKHCQWAIAGGLAFIVNQMGRGRGLWVVE